MFSKIFTPYQYRPEQIVFTEEKKTAAPVSATASGDADRRYNTLLSCVLGLAVSGMEVFARMEFLCRQWWRKSGWPDTRQ
jgi:hypothetical protein